MIVNTRTVVLLLPVYVAAMILFNIIFESNSFDSKGGLPLWLIIAFTASAIFSFGVMAWYIAQKARGKISVKRERFYLGMLIAMFISDSIDDALKGLASLVFKTSSIWVMIPMYVFSYIIMWTVFIFVFTKIIKNPDAAVPENAAGDR